MCSNAGSIKRYGGGGDNINVLETRELVSERERHRDAVDQVLSVSQSVVNDYGRDVIPEEFQVAKIQGSAMAYYDSENNIAVNEKYFNNLAATTRAYDECVKEGFHPGRGNKTALEAITAHEYGHGLTAAVGRQIGMNDLHVAADRIVSEARRQTSHRGVVQMANAISRYATHSNAEAVAEAFADVFCNGGRAKRESRAIMSVVDGYLKKGR